MTLLFVYGSLLSGESNHGVLEGSVRVAPARTKPRYTLVDLGPYPGLCEGSTAIVGELYRVDAALLARIDRFEGSGFERRMIELEDGAAEAYFLRAPRPRGRIVDGGDWRRR